MIFSTDIIIILAVFLIGAAYTAYFGKGRGVTLVLSLTLATLLFEHFPYTKQLTFLKGTQPGAINVIVLYILLTLIVHFILHKHIFGDFGGGTGKMLASILVGLSFTLCLLALWHFVLPLSPLYVFSAKVNAWFTGSLGLFWWTAASLGLLFFV